MQQQTTMSQLSQNVNACMRSIANGCERNPLFDGANQQLSTNGYQNNRWSDASVVGAAFAHYLISREQMQLNPAIETASRVIYNGLLAIVTREAPDYIRNSAPPNTVNFLRNAVSEYNKALQTVSNYQQQMQQQQQQNSWNNNQNQGWGQQQQSTWGQQQGSWGQQQQQQQGSWNQQNTWSNDTMSSNQVTDTLGGNSQSKDSIVTGAGEYGMIDPFMASLELDEEREREEKARNQQQQSQPQSTGAIDIWSNDPFSQFNDTTPATPTPNADGYIVVDGVRYRRDDTAQQTQQPTPTTRDTLLASGMRSVAEEGPATYWGNSALDEAFGEPWMPLQVEDPLPEVQPEPEHLLDEPEVEILKDLPTASKADQFKVFRRQRKRHCIVYNTATERPKYRESTGEIVMKKVIPTMDYEAHETEMLVKPTSRLNDVVGDLTKGKELLENASLTVPLEEYKKATIAAADNKAGSLDKIIEETNTISIDQLVTATNRSEYFSAPIAVLREAGIPEAALDPANNTINYNAVQTSDFVISGSTRELLGSALRARAAGKIVEYLIDFHVDSGTPEYEMNRLHEEGTVLLNKYLATHFEEGLTVDSFLNDYDDLLAIVVEDYPGENTVKTLNNIYQAVTREIYGGFDASGLTNRGLSAEEYGLDEDNSNSVIATVTNVTLLPCRYADIPFGFVGNIGCIDHSTPALYDMLDTFSSKNPNMVSFKFLTMDNVEFNFIKSVAAGESTTFYLIR